MRRRARLLIGAVALVAGVAIFWLSISLATRDRIYGPGRLASACLHEGDAERFFQNPDRFRAYLASVVVRDAGLQSHPPRLSGHAAQILIDRFGYLLVSQNDYVHLIETMRLCGGPPVSS